MAETATDPKLPKGAELNEDGSITYTLQRPITLKFRKGEEEREEQLGAITLREPDGGDMMILDQVAGGVSRKLNMIANLSINPPRSIEHVKRIKARDFSNLVDVLDYFLGGGPLVGGTT